MANQVLVISLHSMESIGGGERYTLDSIKAIRTAGTNCRAVAISKTPPPHLASPDRLKLPAVEISDTWDSAGNWCDVLSQAARAEIIWVHQYLSNSLLIDLIANVASDQKLILTGEGHEPLKPWFDSCFQPYNQVALVEISQYAASRAAHVHQRIARPVSAGIWLSDIRSDAELTEKKQGQICALGRVLPHKGIEHTIQGVPTQASLKIVGPYQPESDYFVHLRSLPCKGDLDWAGAVSESRKWEILRQSELLVASSCHRLFNGVVIEQPELLGLVIFEALAAGVIPITSDIPVFREVMTSLELGDLVYAEGCPGRLQERIEQYWNWPKSEQWSRLSRARALMKQKYLWDDFWTRVQQATGF